MVHDSARDEPPGLKGVRIMSDTSLVGSRQPGDDNNLFRAISFLARQITNQHWTFTAVKILAVYGGGVGSPPTVDVQPLVNQVDGLGNATPHAPIYGIPVQRVQAGPIAIIWDPIVGDTGVAAFADHDISSVVANAGAQSNPGSARRFSASDGIYLFSILGETPTTYIQSDGAGNINITATGNVTVISDNVSLGALGGMPVARVGDSVSGGFITSGSAKVTCG